MFSAITSSHVSTIEGKMPPDGTLLTRDYLEPLLPTIAPIWAEQGFSELFVFDASEAATAPQYCALYEGEWAFICMPRHITAPLDMGAFPQEQTAYCEGEAVGARVFYACLLGVDNGDSWQLQITNCVLVRENGVWLPELRSQQFLPFSIRTVWGRYTAFLGAAEGAKLAVMLPYVTGHMEPFDLFVPGLYTTQQAQRAPYRLYSARGFDSCVLQIGNRKEDKGELHDIHFCVAGHGKAVLEVCETPAKGDASGLLQLAHPDSPIVTATCPQAACMPQQFKEGMFLRGHLNLYADSFGSGEEVSYIEDGPDYEEARRLFRETEGREAPEDLGVKFCHPGNPGLKELGNGRAGLCGEVQEVAPCNLGFTRLTCYTVRCFEDEEALVNVYVHKDVQGDFSPQPGDTIRATGLLNFLALERVEDADAPQPSDERLWGTPQAKYEELAPFGMGHALVARSVREWGWHLLDTPCTTFSGRWYSLAAERPDGVCVAFYVDTVVDGREPVLAFNPQIIGSHKTRVCERWGESALFCQVRIYLDSDEKTGLYTVRGSITPGGIAPELSLPAQTKPYTRPCDQMGAGAQELDALSDLQISLSTGAWGCIARWLRDDAKFLDLSTGLQFSTKEDTLRHLAMQERNAPKGTRYVRGNIKKPGGEPDTHSIAVITDGKVTACYFLLMADGMASAIAIMPQIANQLFVPDK